MLLSFLQRHLRRISAKGAHFFELQSLHEAHKVFLMSFLRTLYARRVSKLWTELSDALAGLMCASLRAVPHETIVPRLSFRPTSTGPYGVSSASTDELVQTHVRYSSLPRETVCTENLTPWTKLLPCDVKVCFLSLEQEFLNNYAGVTPIQHLFFFILPSMIRCTVLLPLIYSLLDHIIHTKALF